MSLGQDDRIENAGNDAQRQPSEFFGTRILYLPRLTPAFPGLGASTKDERVPAKIMYSEYAVALNQTPVHAGHRA